MLFAGAGAYIGLLQQLGIILQPADPWQPIPGVPDPPGSAPAQEWCDKKSTVQWQNSCFKDLTGNWRPYTELLPGRYAIKVRNHSMGSQGVISCLVLQCITASLLVLS